MRSSFRTAERLGAQDTGALTTLALSCHDRSRTLIPQPCKRARRGHSHSSSTTGRPIKVESVTPDRLSWSTKRIHELETLLKHQTQV